MAADSITTQQRSENMRRIRSTDTGPEMAVRRLLHREGFRYRLHSKAVPGTPDIVLPRHKLAIFVHGCFWHGHTCKDGGRPKSNTDYWNTKLQRNIERDAQRGKELRKLGWKTVVVWSCEVSDEKRILQRIRRRLK